MNENTVFEIAALTSALLPKLSVAGAQICSKNFSETDERFELVTAVISDAAGRKFDVTVTKTAEGEKLLARRAKAAKTIYAQKEPSGLGFALENAVAFHSADKSTSGKAILVTRHSDGNPVRLDSLTENQCAAAGTAIGAIHCLNADFLKDAKYPAYDANHIRNQLISWVKHLKTTGHIPEEITDNWAKITETAGMFNFSSVLVHGGFDDGDILFSTTGTAAVKHWENMQISDPARDLAWIFTRLDSQARTRVLSAYGRILGSRMDDMIMLRAGLWVQMEQVGELMDALSRADTERIMTFRAEVERLAHDIAQTSHSHAKKTCLQKKKRNSSTLTVGDLLDNAQAAGIRSENSNENRESKNKDSKPESRKKTERPDNARQNGESQDARPQYENDDTQASAAIIKTETSQNENGSKNSISKNENAAAAGVSSAEKSSKLPADRPASDDMPTEVLQKVSKDNAKNTAKNADAKNRGNDVMTEISRSGDSHIDDSYIDDSQDFQNTEVIAKSEITKSGKAKPEAEESESEEPETETQAV